MLKESAMRTATIMSSCFTTSRDLLISEVIPRHNTFSILISSRLEKNVLFKQNFLDDEIFLPTAASVCCVSRALKKCLLKSNVAIRFLKEQTVFLLSHVSYFLRHYGTKKSI